MTNHILIIWLQQLSTWKLLFQLNLHPFSTPHTINYFKVSPRDFPVDIVVKTSPSNAGSAGSDPWSGR